MGYYIQTPKPKQKLEQLIETYPMMEGLGGGL